MVQERIGLTIECENIKEIHFDKSNKILYSYQNILDRSYRTYQGKDRINRNEFNVTCKNLRSRSRPRPKSFSIEFLIYINKLFPLMPANPISALTEGVFKLFKKIHEIGPTYEIVPVPNQNITKVTSEGDKIYVNPILLKAPDKVRESFHDLASCMKEGEITKITSYALTNPKNGFSMTYKEAEELFPNPEMKKNEGNMEVKIYKFNLKSGKGMLSITNPVEQSDVKFDVAEKDNEETAQALKNSSQNPDSYSNVAVKVDIGYHRKSGKKKINCLHIKEIENIT